MYCTKKGILSMQNYHKEVSLEEERREERHVGYEYLAD